MTSGWLAINVSFLAKWLEQIQIQSKSLLLRAGLHTRITKALSGISDG